MSIRTRYPLLQQRRTKIVVTLGPASEAPGTIRHLIQAGADVFRLNLSHGSHEQHRLMYGRVRRAAAKLKTPVAVLADLCGPRIRVGRFREGGIQLKRGGQVTLSTRGVLGRTGLIPCQRKVLLKAFKPGDRLLLKDGLLELRVTKRLGTAELRCEVLRGGELRDHNGVNLPGGAFPLPALTPRDRCDAAFAAALGVDFIALSFACSAADIEDLRACLRGASGKRIHIIAKIERAAAMKTAGAILDAADGIMVARGDLGVELRPEQVPVAQRELILQARLRYKPAIVATQMLESMTENQRPTRAEVTDVAHAVGDSADAVMLSGETAVGRYPVETVHMMDRILRQTEAYNSAQALRPTSVFLRAEGETARVGAAIAQAALELAGQLKAHALVVVSRRGMSAATICAARPDAPVVVLTADRRAHRRMALYWGALPVLTEQAQTRNFSPLARVVTDRLKLTRPGDFILLVQGFSAEPRLNAPSITALKL